MVPRVRIERTLPKELDFESSASTNSASGGLSVSEPIARRAEGADISLGEDGVKGGIVPGRPRPKFIGSF